jgi:hypothetical protein
MNLSHFFQSSVQALAERHRTKKGENQKIQPKTIEKGGGWGSIFDRFPLRMCSFDGGLKEEFIYNKIEDLRKSQVLSFHRPAPMQLRTTRT